MEQEVGTLRVGTLADFVVLSQDIFALPATQLLQTHVLRTVVGGREVFAPLTSGRGR
jgi:predicted amidohydrolase YtcJ